VSRKWTGYRLAEWGRVESFVELQLDSTSKPLN